MSSVRPVRSNSGKNTARTILTGTTTNEIDPTSTPRVGCRSRSSTARFIREPCWQISPSDSETALRRTVASLLGETSTQTSCFSAPTAARKNYDDKFDRLRHDGGVDADAAFTAWCEGKTGFPIVDAGMRQLAAENWMHNRVRMIVASFLVKDLHIPWWRGARYFMSQLVGR